jgi:hypothetical protein
MQPDFSIESLPFQEEPLQRFPLQPLRSNSQAVGARYMLLFLGGIVLLVGIYSLLNLSGNQQQAVAATSILTGVLIWNAWWFFRRQEQQQNGTCFRIDLETAFLLKNGKITQRANLENLQVRQIDPAAICLEGEGWPPILLTRDTLPNPKECREIAQYRVSDGQWQSLLAHLLPQ